MDENDVLAIANLWRRRCEWLWESSFGFATTGENFYPHGKLDLVKLDALIEEDEREGWKPEK